MKQKFKIAVTVAALLWMIVFVQILVTRFYVSHTNFTQAFARNQVTVETSENIDSRNIKEGNTCTEGLIRGKLSNDEKEKLAENLFRTMGGGEVMAGSMNNGNNYYVAYGYTSGIKKVKRVNGRRINLNVAISYDEEKDITNVIMGTPLVNSDF